MGGMFTTTLRTAAPLLLAQLAFAANTLVTQFFLARHSTAALHASLPGSMLAVAYMAFFNATLGYAGTIFARRDGAGDGRGAMAAFVQSVWLTLFPGWCSAPSTPRPKCSPPRRSISTY